MATYEEVLALAKQLALRDQLRLQTTLRETIVVGLEIAWSAPVPFSDAKSLPKVPGTYAIILDAPDGSRMVRIGATRDASRRPANYDPQPFLDEPGLRIVFAEVPQPFRAAMAVLFETGYTDLKGDIDWLEYRMERRLLEAYETKWDTLPPGNFQHGSRRPYMEHITLIETGPLRVIDLPPADLPTDVLEGLRQSEKKAKKELPAQPK